MFELLLLSILCVAHSTLLCPNGASSLGRSDCGYVGISQTDCIMKQCCWQPTNDHSAYCTYPVQINNANYYKAYDQYPTEPFTEHETNVFFDYFLKNINVDSTGAVAAAPDLHTPGGSYFYHWARDGGLSMDTLQSFTNTSFSAKYSSMYFEWIQKIQNEKDPNGIDVRIEPKYEIPSGQAYSGAWCRPQNDGPGLQAIALIKSGLNPAAIWSTVKYNLDYIVSGYDSETCDLWEEIVNADFFWNRVTMAKALSIGAKFASRLGYTNDAQTWSNLANRIQQSVYETHWNGYYYYESNNRPVDGAVIIGLNFGYDEDTNFLNPLSYEVASTVYYYNLVFSDEYTINQKDRDLYGILYGRYPGDVYAGGNPWIITTAALANLMYRISAKLQQGQYMSRSTLEMWEHVFNIQYLPRETSEFFKAQGDGLLLRLKHYIQPYNYHMYEQIDKNNGTQISAYDLTWSYAEVLNALVSREKI